jgi:hypothetical protein
MFDSADEVDFDEVRFTQRIATPDGLACAIDTLVNATRFIPGSVIPEYFEMAIEGADYNLDQFVKGLQKSTQLRLRDALTEDLAK